MEYLGLEGGPPGFPRDFSCPMVLWCRLSLLSFAYETITLYGHGFPSAHSAGHTLTLWRSTTPSDRSPRVWPVPLSLATTYGISVDFFSCGYLDVSVPHVSRLHAMDSRTAARAFTPGRLPHSDICGSMAMCASPQLIAACHVLHRLMVPRHSPCALCNLTSF